MNLEFEASLVYRVKPCLKKQTATIIIKKGQYCCVWWRRLLIPALRKQGKKAWRYARDGMLIVRICNSSTGKAEAGKLP